jgi:hypothetical protein
MAGNSAAVHLLTACLQHVHDAQGHASVGMWPVIVMQRVRQHSETPDGKLGPVLTAHLATSRAMRGTAVAQRHASHAYMLAC